MKAKKRGWNGLVKSSKLSQVRESSDLDSYHRKRAASSLVADCTNPQRPPAETRNKERKPLGTGVDTHTHTRMHVCMHACMHTYHIDTHLDMTQLYHISNSKSVEC